MMGMTPALAVGGWGGWRGYNTSPVPYLDSENIVVVGGGCGGREVVLRSHGSAPYTDDVAGRCRSFNGGVLFEWTHAA